MKRMYQEVGYFYPLADLFSDRTIISDNNVLDLLLNGEEKFARLKEDLLAAKKHIHMEYYIYSDNKIGNEIADILAQKAQEGLEVRFVYDALGSRAIEKELVPRLRDAGVEAYPFYELKLFQFLNRLNYRNHRKIVVIDGKIGYVGGINVSDEYINAASNDLYWRDTHMCISGSAVWSLQVIFLSDWNFCAEQNIAFSESYFPVFESKNEANSIVNIVASGPDSDYPNIMYSLMYGVMLSRNTIDITTPYFIPDKTFLDALKVASLRGTRVRLLVPEISDSRIVSLTSESFYTTLLEA